MYPLGIAILSQGDMLGATVVEVLPSCAQLVFGQTRLGRLLLSIVFPGLELVPPDRSDVVGLPL